MTESIRLRLNNSSSAGALRVTFRSYLRSEYLNSCVPRGCKLPWSRWNSTFIFALASFGSGSLGSQYSTVILSASGYLMTGTSGCFTSSTLPWHHMLPFAPFGLANTSRRAPSHQVSNDFFGIDAFSDASIDAGVKGMWCVVSIACSVVIHACISFLDTCTGTTVFFFGTGTTVFFFGSGVGLFHWDFPDG